MKFFLVLVGLCFVAACSDDADDTKQSSGNLRLAMAVETSGSLNMYIRSLSVYAFRRQENGTYVFFRSLAELNGEDIQNLEERQEKAVSSKILHIELPVGNYRLYVVGNAAVKREEGGTSPSEFYMQNPGTDLVISGFVGEAETSVGETLATVPVVLKRVVSRLYVSIEEIPYQIDSVMITMNGLADRIYLDGTPGGKEREVSYTYLVKNETVYTTYDLHSDFLTFPSLADGSVLNLTFLSRSGEKRTKAIDVQMVPNRYVYIRARIGYGEDALLSYDYSVLYFFAWDWRDIDLPGFVLNPYER